MSGSIPRLFADIVGMLEDMHAVAVEGQRGDNSADMQRVLACFLRSSTATVDASLAAITCKLGDGNG